MRISTDTVFKAISITATAAVLILIGMFWGWTKFPPANFFREALVALAQMERGPRAYHWHSKRPGWRAGVTVYEPDSTFGAYTLYTNVPRYEALLVDMKGEVQHRWQILYSSVWDETAPEPESKEGVFEWFGAKMMDNGDLYAVFHASPGWPYGRGLVKLDKDSRVIWKNLDFIHHDFDVGEDGSVYALSQTMKREFSPYQMDLLPPYLEDHVVRIDPQGNITKRIGLAEAILRSPDFEGLMYFARQDKKGDYFHANSVVYVTEAMARSHPYADPGDLMISINHLSTLVLLDPATGEINWALRGPWSRIHDPDPLDNGNILIFDNEGHLGAGGATRILEFDPVSLTIEWQFHGDSRGDSELWLESRTQGSQQRLDNGNTLISESTGGRLLEVTPGGSVVWEYWNPAVHPARDDLTGTLNLGHRFTAEEIRFPFNGGVIVSGE
jgi:hypothetical protein